MSATGTIYGYCRISTEKQNVKRQIRAIIANYPQPKFMRKYSPDERQQDERNLKRF